MTITIYRPQGTELKPDRLPPKYLHVHWPDGRVDTYGGPHDKRKG